ncbi:putative d-serine dehydratase transcriptional activator [Enterobacter hormaechei]|nr:putative d-serine dehydratase transcriptional activator [Enterobacter hormaechei]
MTDANEGRNRLLNGWQLSKMYTFEVAARHESFALGRSCRSAPAR